MHVRAATADDRAWIESSLAEHRSTRVARRGEIVRPIDYPMLVAESDGGPAALLTYIITATDCEILTLHANRQWAGAGTALIDAVRAVAVDRGCRRLLVLTTNDNVDALRFYQRRGFRLEVLRPGAVDDARRRLKPEIPDAGEYGIPIRDELELDLQL